METGSFAVPARGSAAPPPGGREDEKGSRRCGVELRDAVYEAVRQPARPRRPLPRGGLALAED